MEKVLASGEFGSVSVSESAGVFSLNATIKTSIGGGAVKGAIGIQSANSIQLSAIQLGDAGLLALEGLFPSFKVEIELLKSALDAEIAKL